MLAVSQDFRTAIPRGHQVVTVCTSTVPGGTPATLTVSAGTVNADRSQRIRRTAPNIAVRGGSDLYEQLSTPGCRITVDHGFDFGGGVRELVPLIRGELSSAALQLGDGLIQIAVADLWQGIAGADFLAPYSPAVTARRVNEIAAAVVAVYPGITVRNTATDRGTIGTAQAWTSRADMITALANDGGSEAYFAADGAFVIRDQRQISDAVAWLIKTGPGGTLETLTRNRPLDRVFNTVVLEPATADPSQDWDQVVVQITDLDNPRHPARLGRVAPFRYSAPTLLTEAAAIDVATQLLTKVQGSTETLSLGAMANPALEEGDIVRVLTPIDGGNTIVNHFLDSYSIDLVSSSMSCGTRASQELTT